jgi:hypothetical protein
MTPLTAVEAGMKSIKRAMIGASVALAAAIGGAGVSTTSAEAGWRGGPWRFGPYARHGYYRRPNYGGAVAAGVVGGLALGALAASRPVYAYPAYGPLVYGPDCHVARRTYYDAWGNAVVRRVQICD